MAKTGDPQSDKLSGEIVAQGLVNNITIATNAAISGGLPPSQVAAALEYLKIQIIQHDLAFQAKTKKPFNPMVVIEDGKPEPK